MLLPKLRLHLLTCVVLMFVAGALIWANIRTIQIEPISKFDLIDFTAHTHSDSTANPNDWTLKFQLRRGWPLPYQYIAGPSGPSVIEANYYVLGINGQIGIALLSFVAFICEVLLRRRSNRTASPPRSAGK